MTRWLRRIFLAAIGAYAATFTFIYVFSSTFENPVTIPRSDLIVCLSAGVNPKGVLDEGSTKRALTCAELFAQGAAPAVLFTGGNGAHDAPSAARGMAQTAIAAGVPEDVVILEEQARSTLQNALFSLPDLQGVERIVLVTEGFHLPRSYATFAAFGDWDMVMYMSVPFRLDPDGTVRWSMIHRETLAWWFNLGRYTVWKIAKFAGADSIDHWLT